MDYSENGDNDNYLQMYMDYSGAPELDQSHGQGQSN